MNSRNKEFAFTKTLKHEEQEQDNFKEELTVLSTVVV